MRTNIHASHSPAMSSSAFGNRTEDTGPLATDCFPSLVHSGTQPSRSMESTTLTPKKGPWGQALCEELGASPCLDADVSDFQHSMFGQEESIPIINVRQYVDMEYQDPGNMSTGSAHSIRRMSAGSSFSMSSTSGVPPPEATPYEELDSSDVISYAQAYESWSQSEPASRKPLSPVASPRRLPYEGIRTHRSPVTHGNVRSSPYALDSSPYHLWSTGQAPLTPISSRAMAQAPDCHAPYGLRPNPHQSMPTYSSRAFSPLCTPAPDSMLYSQNHALPANHQSLCLPDHAFQVEGQRPVPSQGLFRFLQSSADRPVGGSSHFADVSDPPDLYSSLQEEPSTPPESDMKPADPDLMPHAQDVRFPGDLYTPRWIRGHGNKREGWCGLCKPGRWLVLKNSAFWYDKSFTHGVSAATGAAFQGPQDTRRADGNLDVWEGLCGSCGEWIALVSSKKKGTTWFRHAYKVSIPSHHARSPIPPVRFERFPCRGVTRGGKFAEHHAPSATPTPKSSRDSNGVARPKLDVFAPGRPPRPRRCIPSSRRCLLVLPCRTDIPRRSP